MLVNLNIIDLAVVKSLDLELAKGMSALTGETGAGKSILLTALGLALGDRADASYIRPQAKRAEINLEFDLSEAKDASDWLRHKELDSDGTTCFVRRVINSDGRSKAYINNTPVNLQTLQELSEKLVEIQGQHAHLSLLNSEEQRRLLDAFANNHSLLEQLNDCYKRWQKADKELTQLRKSAHDQTVREEFLRYQIDELQQLDLAQFDYQALSDEHDKIANLEQILATGQALVDRLYEQPHSVNDLLNLSINELTQLTRLVPELAEIASLLTDAQIQTEEAVQALRRYLDNEEADPARLDALEQQLSLIHSLSRKHHVSPEQLPAHLASLEHELTAITSSSERMIELAQEVETWLKHYQELALELRQHRQIEAQRLAQHISAEIKELGMPQGEFTVQVTAHDHEQPRLNGKDHIVFLVSANPGLPAKPLAKVASGGELSRISLAIQVITGSDKTTPTMIFDEVDTGIGGGIAEIVGQKLRRLSQNRQILCVTHLAQVAAQAHHHLYVKKNQDTDITSSSVRLLTPDERVEETARMLGGITITENTLAHAREMLALAESDSTH